MGQNHAATDILLYYFSSITLPATRPFRAPCRPRSPAFVAQSNILDSDLVNSIYAYLDMVNSINVYTNI